MAPVDGDTIAVIKVAVTLRNALAHIGNEVPRDRLLKTLRAIRNMLWTLDVARGHAWSAKYLSPLDRDLSVGYQHI
jgi:hypothetical protein